MNIKSKKILAQLSAVVLVGSAMTAPIAGMAEDVVSDGTAVTVENVAPVVKATPEAPAVEAPVVEAPAVETPSVEAPVVEAPAVDVDAVEAPVVEAPAIDIDAVGDVVSEVEVEDKGQAVVSDATGTKIVEFEYPVTTTTTTTAPAPDYAKMPNGWGYAYKDFIENDYIVPEGSENDMHFALVYLDDDDIPELIMSEGSGDGQTSKIFRFTADGSVEEVGYGTNFGSILYSDENNLIYNVYNETDDYGKPIGQTTKITKLVDGELKTVASFYRDNKNGVFKINGVVVNEAEFLRQLKNYKINIPTTADGHVDESYGYDIGSILNKDIKDVQYSDMIQVNSFTKNLFQHLLDNASANGGKVVKPAVNNNTTSTSTACNGAPAAPAAPAPASAPAVEAASDSPETGDKGVGAILGAIALSAGAMVATKKRKRS